MGLISGHRPMIGGVGLWAGSQSGSTYSLDFNLSPPPTCFILMHLSDFQQWGKAGCSKAG